MTARRFFESNIHFLRDGFELWIAKDLRERMAECSARVLDPVATSPGHVTIRSNEDCPRVDPVERSNPSAWVFDIHANPHECDGEVLCRSRRAPVFCFSGSSEERPLAIEEVEGREDLALLHESVMRCSCSGSRIRYVVPVGVFAFWRLRAVRHQSTRLVAESKVAPQGAEVPDFAVGDLLDLGRQRFKARDGADPLERGRVFKVSKPSPVAS